MLTYRRPTAAGCLLQAEAASAEAEKIPYARERLILHRLVLDFILSRSAHDGPFQPLDFVITVAVSIATLEGRTVTANKLSQVLGLPRSTIIRRSDALVREGIFGRDGTGYCTTLKWYKKHDGPPRTIKTVLRAAADLAALDHSSASSAACGPKSC